MRAPDISMPAKSLDAFTFQNWQNEYWALQDGDGNTLYSEVYDSFDVIDTTAICGLQPACYTFITSSQHGADSTDGGQLWTILDSTGAALHSGGGGETVEVCVVNTLAPTNSPPTPLPTVSVRPTTTGTRYVSTYLELKEALYNPNHVNITKASTCFKDFILKAIISKDPECFKAIPENWP